MELTEIETVLLNGKPSGEIRNELSKARASEKQKVLAAREAERVQEQHFCELAEAAKTTAVQEIMELCRELDDQQSPNIELSVDVFISHLKHEQAIVSLEEQRAKINQTLSGLDEKLANLDAEKARLVAGDRSKPEIVGQLGLVLMDIESIEALSKKLIAEFHTIPIAGEDKALAAWNENIRSAKINAITGLVDKHKAILEKANTALRIATRREGDLYGGHAFPQYAAQQGL